MEAAAAKFAEISLAIAAEEFAQWAVARRRRSVGLLVHHHDVLACSFDNRAGGDFATHDLKRGKDYRAALHHDRLGGPRTWHAKPTARRLCNRSGGTQTQNQGAE